MAPAQDLDVQPKRELEKKEESTTFLPEMRIVLPLASTVRSSLRTPGISMNAAKSVPRLKTLIGGNAPVPVVASSSQSLSSRWSSAR